MMRNDRQEEYSRLNHVADDSWYGSGPNADSIRYCARVFARFLFAGSCLELGPAEGIMTAFLAERFQDLTCVDGARRFCEKVKERFPNIEVVCSLFEHYNPRRRFDNVVMGHVLEHVKNPHALLVRARTRWVAPGGRVLACVPNARSIHRQLGVIMRLLDTEHSLNEMDMHHGHRRVYDPESLRGEFLRAGYDIEHFGGYWLKPISNGQIRASWTPEMLDAAMKLGERYPDISAEIYVVATAR